MTEKLVQLIAYRDWLIGVTRHDKSQYFCWVFTPEAIALTDAEGYPSAKKALKAGRVLVSMSVD